MKNKIQRIQPNLWFKSEAKEAAEFYTSIFENSKINKITYYGNGNVMNVEFELDGQKFVALNGGKLSIFTPAISFIVNCNSQEEIDYYWDKLTEGADELDQACGWLKDKYGVSWQNVPAILSEMMNDPNKEKSERVMKALLKMEKKLDMEKLILAYEGK